MPLSKENGLPLNAERATHIFDGTVVWITQREPTCNARVR